MKFTGFHFDGSFVRLEPVGPGLNLVQCPIVEHAAPVSDSLRAVLFGVLSEATQRWDSRLLGSVDVADVWGSGRLSRHRTDRAAPGPLEVSTHEGHDLRLAEHVQQLTDSARRLHVVDFRNAAELSRTAAEACQLLEAPDPQWQDEEWQPRERRALERERQELLARRAALDASSHPRSPTEGAPWLDGRIADCLAREQAARRELEDVTWQLRRASPESLKATAGGEEGRIRTIDAQIERIEQVCRDLHLRQMDVQNHLTQSERPDEAPLEENLTRLRSLASSLDRQVAWLAEDEELGRRGSERLEIESDELRRTATDLQDAVDRQERQLTCEALRNELKQLRRCRNSLRQRLQRLWTRRYQLSRREAPPLWTGVPTSSVPTSSGPTSDLARRRDRLSESLASIQRELSELRGQPRRPAPNEHQVHAKHQERTHLEQRLAAIERQLRAALSRRRTDAGDHASFPTGTASGASYGYDPVDDAAGYYSGPRYVSPESLRAGADFRDSANARNAAHWVRERELHRQQLQREWDAGTLHPRLATAATLLSRLTGGELTRIRNDQRANTLLITDYEGKPHASYDLPTDVQRLVALSLVLSAADPRFPILLDRLFEEIPATSFASTLEVLRDTCRDGRQIVVTIYDPTTAEQLRRMQQEVRHADTPLSPEEDATGERRAAETWDAWQPAPRAFTHHSSPQQWRRVERPARIFDDAASRVISRRDQRNGRHHLDFTDPVTRIPFYDRETGERLEQHGYWTVADLLRADADEVALQLHERATVEEVRRWQAQCQLMCSIARLRAFDARVLVACGVTDPVQLQDMEPRELMRVVGTFLDSASGQRLARSASPFEISRIRRWIESARTAGAGGRGGLGRAASTRRQTSRRTPQSRSPNRSQGEASSTERRRPDYERPDYERDEYERNDYERNDYERNDYERNDYERNDYERNDYERNDYERDENERDEHERDASQRTAMQRERASQERASQERAAYDRVGYDGQGFDREGFGIDGFDRDGFDRDGYDCDGYDCDGYDCDGYDCDGSARTASSRETLEGRRETRERRARSAGDKSPKPRRATRAAGESRGSRESRESRGSRRSRESRNGRSRDRDNRSQSRTGQRAPAVATVTSHRVVTEGNEVLRFHLDESADVEAAPSIGPKTAELLYAIGVRTVADLLARDPETIALELAHPRINGKTILEWQQQSTLVCRIPELRGHDAQLLVACGFTTPEQIMSAAPAGLFGAIGPFAETKAGQRIIRSGKAPTLEEATDWIRWSKLARHLRAA